MRYEELFDQFRNIRVGVVGDVMLDTYMWGRVDRISPEAPVPVVALNKKDYRIGGAGNVALNLQALGAQVSVLSVIGADGDGRILRELLASSGIDGSYLLDSASRITTNKIRVIARNQQMMRLDNEVTTDLTVEDAMLLEAHILRYLDEVKPQVLIFEDYNKGVLTEGLIGTVVRLCRERGVLTAVDPKRKHFFSYRDVDIFKPNLKEVREGLNLIEEEVSLEWLQNVHAQLYNQLHHQISFITLSERGVFFQDGASSGLLSSHVRNIADVSGAGDTVIAVASLVYAATRDVRLMAAIANIAGGLVCEEVGTAAIRRDVLLAECKVLL
jgi:rfaE bifunctional protein kinase chain/domain